MDIFTNYYCNMSAKTDKTLTDRLKEELEKRKVSVPSFETQTGIPKDRVYKWLKRSTDHIDHKDAEIVKAWLDSDLDKFPKKETGEKNIDELIASNRILAEANKILAEAHSTISRNNEELIRIAVSLLAKNGSLPLPLDPGKNKGAEGFVEAT